jgi:ankyrin repeat protein
VVDEISASVKYRNYKNETVLHYAAQIGLVDVVIWLVEQMGMRVTDLQKDGSTALHFAASGGQLEVVKWLVNEKRMHINDWNNFGKTAAHLAARHFEVYNWLVEQGAKVNTPDTAGRTAASYAESAAISRRWRQTLREHIVTEGLGTRHGGAQRRAQRRWNQGKEDDTELIAKEPEKGANTL